MQSASKPWNTFFELVSNPFRLLQGTIEFGMAWVFTRNWSACVWYMPVLLILSVFGVLIAIGWFQSDEALMTKYTELVETEISQSQNTESSDENVESNGNTPAARADDLSRQFMETQSVTAFEQMLLRRILQLQDFNTRANYLVAAHVGRQGRLGQARQMMRKIAPLDSTGYPPAHAWLATYRLSSGLDQKSDRDELLHDLEIASTWSGCGPLLLATYADLLESVGRIGDAIAVLNVAVQSEPELQVKLADLAYRHGRKHPLEQQSQEAKQRIQAKLETEQATTSDFTNLAHLQLLDEEPDEAIETATEGLKREPENPQLKRIISESLRVKYVRTVRTSDDGTQVDLGLLDAALKADPSNPGVSQEVARIVAMGAEARPELIQALEQQLVNGQATALTHIMLATRKLRDGDIEAAVPHLESALRQAPDSPVVLNNLALALAQTRPDQLERSLQLIDTAVKQVPDSAEYRDTQGEIRTLAGDYPGAIESYEEALRLDGSRLDTRQKLALVYEQFGLLDMARAQRREIDRRSAEQAETTPQDAGVPAEAASTDPEITEPEITDPEITDPEITEPEITEPGTTEPETTEPETTEPETTEPETTEPEKPEPEAAQQDQAKAAEPTKEEVVPERISESATKPDQSMELDLKSDSDPASAPESE